MREADALKGVILAGGRGTRLRPLTDRTNKHLLPVGGEPMILHPVRKLAAAGVRDILIVAGPQHLGAIEDRLGRGERFGCRLRYRAQDRPRGIAHAVSLAESFAGAAPICVHLGDNLLEDELTPYAARFREQGEGALLLLKRVPDPHRYGVARVQGDRIAGIWEKPERPASGFAVTGIYFYDAKVFDLIRGLRPSPRGELEITDLNNAYVRRGEAGFAELRGWWIDAGTFEGLAEGDRRLRARTGEDDGAR